MMMMFQGLRRSGLTRHPLAFISQQQQQQQQRRSISLLNRLIVTSNDQQRQDLDHAVQLVRQHDPAGFLPGLLLPAHRRRQQGQQMMQVAYFAVRSFWVETGLRFGTTALVPPNSTPLEHLDWWSDGIQQVFSSDNNSNNTLPPEWNHPTLRLLKSLLRDDNNDMIPWQQEHFDTILQGRKQDLDVQQYETLHDLIVHAQQSCGNLSQLVLESGHMTTSTHPKAHEAARRVGICHGLTNALRTSIPVVSTTGKLIIPAELTTKYGVKSPRYLLSALGQGDQACVLALQQAVEEIATVARQHLQQARDLRSDVLQEQEQQQQQAAVAVLLPGLASETFLNRLQRADYQLTDRNLRNVGLAEHLQCAARMIVAYYRQTY